MDKFLKKGRTLLISGLASIILTTGSVAALGFTLPIGKKIVVRKNKAIPFEAEEDSTLKIVLNENLDMDEITGSTIPDSWEIITDRILKLPMPCTVLVLGDVDCGKNTFCIFLANQMVAYGLKPAIMDADIGQSEICPPTTIGLTSITEPTIDLFSLNTEKTFFVGLTSPNRAIERIISGLTYLKRGFFGTLEHILIVNTDGWIREEAARKYKLKMIKALNPEAIVALQNTDELEPLLEATSKTSKVLRVKCPAIIKTRGKEIRKELREQSYKKFLDNATIRCIPISRTRFEFPLLGNSIFLAPNKVTLLDGILDNKTLYCRENLKEFFVVTEGNSKNIQKKATIREQPRKRLLVAKKQDLLGLLVGLCNNKYRFLGIGIISDMDYENRILKVITPCKERVDIVQVGQVKVDKFGRKKGYTKTTLANQMPK